MAFRSYMAEHGLELDDTEWDALINHAGHSPFMLSKAAEKLFYSNGDLTVTEILENYEKEHYEYFRDLIEALRKDKQCLKHIIQIFLGPKYDLTQEGIDELILYGYIWIQKNKDKYETISPVFERYLRNTVRNEITQQFWPFMADAEKSIRNLISRKLREEFGDIWEKNLRAEASNSKIKGKMIINLERIDKYKANRGENLIDLCNFSEYYKIIDIYKKGLFREYFDEKRLAELKACCDKIHIARNNFAHINDNLLTDKEVNGAKQACETIIEWARTFNW
jgi:hypothetical protein